MTASLKIPIKLDLSGLKASVTKLRTSISSATKIELNGLNVSPTLAKLNTIKAQAASIDLTTEPERSVAVWDRKSKLIDETTGNIFKMSTGVENSQKSLAKTLVTVGRIDTGFRNITANVKQVSGQVSRIKAPDFSSGSQTGGFIKIAAITAGVASLGKVNSAMASVKSAAQTASAGIDQFRSAATAPIVNPKLNTLANSISGIGKSLSKTLEGMRGRLDAVLSAPLVTLTALRTQLGGLVNIGNDTVSMFARWATMSSTMTAALQSIGVSAETTRSTIATLQGIVASVTQSGSIGVSKLSGAIASLGGTFENAAGSAQTFNFASETLSRPLQLATKWAIAGEKASTKWAASKRLMLTPITLVKEAIQGEVQSFRLMRAEVNKLPAKQRLVTIAMHELYFATRPIRKIFGGVSAVARGLLSPALKGLSSTGGKLTNSFRSVATGIKKASLSITRTIAPTNILSGAFRRLKTSAKGIGAGIASQLGNIKLALAAATAAAVGFGFKSAISAQQTETRFATMLRSGVQAKALMASLDGFAAKTPFSKDAFVDATQQLLTAKVPVDQISSKLTVLGNIAAGTGKPIVEFAKIFAKVSNTGKVSLETLNQFAERGVPIYDSLKTTLGVTRKEMLSMISKGEVGFSSLETAINSTATGTGLFAGGMKNLSTTTGGLLSTMKDNFLGVFKDFSGILMKAINFDSLVSGANSFFLRLRSGMSVASGLANQAAATMKAYWGVWVTGGKTAFNAIVSFVQPVTDSIKGMLSKLTGSAGLTFRSLAELSVKALATAEFAFLNWKSVGALAILNIQLGAVQFFETLKHFFTAQMPAYLTWFGTNWKSVFFTAFDLVSTVFINIGQNIRGTMSAIWDYIKSGGTASLSLAWTPLLDGFRSTVAEMPNIAARVKTDIEKNLNGAIGDLKTELKVDLDLHIGDAVAKFNKAFEPPPVPDGTKADQTGRIEEGADGSVDTGNKRKSNAVQSLDRGSEAALQAIFAGGNQDKTAKASLSVQKQMSSTLKKIQGKIQGPANITIAGAI